MSRPLIALIGLTYSYIAIEMGWRGNAGLAIMYAGYAVGNVGLWILAGV